MEEEVRKQKAGLFFVIFCGLAALLLGGQFLWASVAKPFAINYTGPRLLTGAEKESAEIAKQKQSDTDADEISDYDELYVFKTSPYLSDSDSDGLADGFEITAGSDPNCATGASCESSLLENAEAVLPSNASGTFLEDQAVSSGQSLAGAEQALNQLRSLPTAEIRLLLIDSGADPAMVAEQTDEQIRALFDDILVQLSGNGVLEQLLNPQATPAPELTPVVPTE